MADTPVGRQAERAADDSGRVRLLRAVYEEFSRSGTRNVGVDAVIAMTGILDVCGEWFETPEYEGCSFVRARFLRELATSAGIAEPDAFATQIGAVPLDSLGVTV